MSLQNIDRKFQGMKQSMRIVYCRKRMERHPSGTASFWILL